MQFKERDLTTLPLHAGGERKTTRWRRPTEPPTSVAQVLRHDISLEDTYVERYRTVDSLGRGGMGEVNRATDTLIGRDVALKSLLPIDPVHRGEAVSRFLKEARVQALLEHPAIVPVYDVGFGSDGLPFFTMKQVRGDTLFDLIERTPREPAAKAKALRRMLTAFVTVCRAIHYAHDRGVVHRDLKPDNVMVGSHGEVYVLDWGVAKILPVGVETSVTDELGLEGSETHPGDMVGTPGYLAPEQALTGGDVDGLADVFALGAILYEIVAQRPFLDGTDRTALVRATVDPKRTPPHPADAPPELYALALRATRYRREERVESARALADAVEAYLDGDRDQALRMKLADEHAALARTLANEALDGPVAGRAAARAHAMHEAGRALAILPDHEAASAIVLRLFSTPPETPPAEASRELARLDQAQLKGALRDGAMRTAVWPLFLPLVFALGVKSWALFGLAVVLCLACAGVALSFNRRGVTSTRAPFLLFCLISALGAVAAFIFGPLVFVPGFVATNTLLYSVQISSAYRRPMVAIALLALTLPLALELVGIVSPSMRFQGDGMELLPRMTSFQPVVTVFSLYLVSVVGIVAPSAVALRLRDALRAAEERLILQKWQLAQLAPRLGRDA
jgi:serine/threonine-protein kinase